MEETDSYMLSLVGKFLTCKPYNCKAAKNTLRKSWGLEKICRFLRWAPTSFNSSFNQNMNWNGF